MKINLRYSSFIKIEMYENNSIIEVPERCTVRDLYALLKIPSYLQKSMITRVNDEPVWLATELEENDSVMLLRAMGGG
jgi:sulfur carrier protein ThiS